MRRSHAGSLVIASAVAVLATACSGSSSSPTTGPNPGGSSAPSGSKGTITVGVLLDQTGPGDTNAGALKGVNAAVGLIEQEGWKVNVKTADDQTNPIQARSAAQQLVQRDHVNVAIAASGVFFTAAPVFTAAGIPVVGADEDGPEWGQNKNMFSIIGNVREDEVTTTMDEFLKAQGATTVGSIGYSISEGSAESAQGPAAAAPTVGLKVGYMQSQFPIGSTDLAPTALAMKQHGVDGVVGTVAPSTDIALYQALTNLGAKPKAYVADAGYGADLLNSGPAAVKGAEGMFFNNAFEPVEMNTPSTKRFQAALAAVGVKDEPSVSMYWGYVSGLLLKQVLDHGAKPTSASLLTALQHTTQFNADGLVGPGKNDNVNIRNGQVDGYDNCIFMSKVVNGAFQPVQGALPTCGKLLKGVFVTSTGVAH